VRGRSSVSRLHSQVDSQNRQNPKSREARGRTLTQFRDRISRTHRHQSRPREDPHLTSIPGLTFETLKTLISALAGFVPKLTLFETRIRTVYYARGLLGYSGSRLKPLLKSS
jgi:hypothetical protein